MGCLCNGPHMSRPDLFIFAAEPSADLHGQALIEQILSIRKDTSISSVAGPLMRKHPISVYMEMEKFQVMGFIDVFFALPRLIHLFFTLAKQILKDNPKVAVFIDYPGFTLRMESYLRKKGYRGKLVHYISPTVWIHGKGRIASMAKTLDLLLCILPFEPPLFERSGLAVSYVGHPLVERIHGYRHRPIEELKGKKVLALFPGSRKKEIERNLPLYLDLVRKWQEEEKQITFALSISRREHISLIEKIAKQSGCGNIVMIDEERTYDLMHMAYAAIAKSGTVTLELALHSVPSCITYGVSKIDVFIAQKILRIDLAFYALPNILLGRKMYAELIGPNFTFTNLCNEARMLLDASTRAKQKKLCGTLFEILHNPSSASLSAAEKICQLL